jgi:hypothetical protein
MADKCDLCNHETLGRHEVFCPKRVVSELPKISPQVTGASLMQGWQCPNCKTIMAPHLTGCLKCNNVQTIPVQNMQTREL